MKTNLQNALRKSKALLHSVNGLAPDQSLDEDYVTELQEIAAELLYELEIAYESMKAVRKILKCGAEYYRIEMHLKNSQTLRNTDK